MRYTFPRPLVPKFHLGMPCGRSFTSVVRSAAAKHSFADECAPKCRLGAREKTSQ